MLEWIGPLLLVICLVGFPVAGIKLVLTIRNNSRLKEEMLEKDAALDKLREKNEHFAKENNRLHSLERVVAEELPQKAAAIDVLTKDKQKLEEQVEALSRYKQIVDIDAEIAKKQQAFVDQRNASIAKLQGQVEEAKAKLKAQFEQAQLAVTQRELEKKHIIQSAKEGANRIVEEAKTHALEIAGEALTAKANASHYEQVVLAMKNAIHGYGDEYLVPGHSILDDLAEEFSHKEAGIELANTRKHIKTLISHGSAANCEYVASVQKNNAIHFVLDAFNGKVDSILSLVRKDNYGKLDQMLKDSFHLVNKNGMVFRNAMITHEYLEARRVELKWAVAVVELKSQEMEEQRRIKQEMREEEKARQEFEKALRESEKEEEMLKKAMENARAELADATEEQRTRFEHKLADLQQRLAIAEEKNQRALSMAQQTRQGHVYIISNIGSFGDDVFKIGMTRRLEPIDRVRELGDASVPFSFDVHAMIFSEDAPSLERNLHKTFNTNQMNKINARKEFFKVGIHDIKKTVEDLGIDTKWTMMAEAREYRESQIVYNQLPEA